MDKTLKEAMDDLGEAARAMPGYALLHRLTLAANRLARRMGL